MIQFGSELVDYTPLWAFFLYFARFTGVFLTLPGIGTDYVSPPFRIWAAAIMSFVVTVAAPGVPEARNVVEGTAMLASETCLGSALGLIPSIVLGGLAVAGQVISMAIGLGQANMIDRSLGVSVAVLAKIKISVATVIFLLLDGHHLVIRAATIAPGQMVMAMFRNSPEASQIFLEQLVGSFELAIMLSAPILVTTLVTQFVFGLITKFVPQMNIFIVSLPLGILVGFYILEFSIQGFINHVIAAFGAIDVPLSRLLAP